MYTYSYSKLTLEALLEDQLEEEIQNLVNRNNQSTHLDDKNVSIAAGFQSLSLIQSRNEILDSRDRVKSVSEQVLQKFYDLSNDFKFKVTCTNY